MNQHLLIYFLILFSFGFSHENSLSFQYNSSDCINYYSINNLPASCQNINCFFQSGLQQLIVNSTDVASNFIFLLCLDLSGYDIYIKLTNTTNNFFQQIQSIYILGRKIAINNYSILCTNYFYLYAEGQILISSAQLTGTKIFILALSNVAISQTTFINESIIPSACSCSDQQKNCTWNFQYPKFFNTNGNFNISTASEILPDLLFSNTVTIISQGALSLYSTLIRYSIIGIFAERVIINSSNLTTVGLGFPSDSGPGCGYFDETLNQLFGCMGSGGSHGGFGGSSSPQNCYSLISRQPYGSYNYPSHPGSGGGFFLPHSKQSSSGGGIMNIQALKISLDGINILSEGKNGIQGGGGGAGGSISIDYTQFFSKKTIISVNGGNGDKTSSSGSGGRIRFWNHNWKKQNQSDFSLIITAAGGTGCSSTSQIIGSPQLSCGQSGSVYTSPCRPGTAIDNLSYFCTKCPVGTYQTKYGYSPCLPCIVKPASSNWSEMSIQKSFCAYKCWENTSYFNGQCLQKIDQIWEQIYAVDILICLGIIGGAVLIYLIIICYRKVSQQEAFLSIDDPSLAQNFKRKFFRLQDIPYHQMRIYLEGENHPFSPWRISDQTMRTFQQSLRPPLSRVSSIIERVMKQINKKAAYSKWQKIFIRGLRYTYYPLSRIVLRNLRKKKAQYLFQQIDKFNKRIGSVVEDIIMIKFHVKPQKTIASLEIFNYNKSELDFYLENYFPLYIKLEQVPFGGYMIDFKDPFLKAFAETLQKQGYSRPLEIFFSEANKYLKNPTKTLSCLDHLWKIQQIIPKTQCFLWQPTSKIIGIDKVYKINKKQPLFLVFNNDNQNKRHFIASQELPPIYLPQIETLRHKFIIKKDLASQQEGSSFFIFTNQFRFHVLLWVFGIFNIIFLLLTLAVLILIILIFSKNQICNSNKFQFLYGFIIYFVLWPLCEFFSIFLNFKTLIKKDQYSLADSIYFNILSFLKCFILFISSLITNIKSKKEQNKCLVANEYIWLSMALFCCLIYFVQIMLRARMILQSKVLQ